jgi:Kef-type K+ transport system membrane component KefB
VITCAAVDDITAWSLLAMVIAVVKAGSFVSSMATILMAVGYVFIMLKIIKPFLKRIGDLHASRENLSKPVIAIFFLVLILSSYLTEIIGIHALFGAFMAGVIMPDNQKFRQIIIEKIEDVALVLLLPLFFVYTGLRTQVGLLNEPGLWAICGLVILVAVVGKFGGSSFAARITGQSWKDSLTIGALMNTRGLVELVALNIGYDLGVLTPEIFTILVIMALITTVMTAPALHAIEKLFAGKNITVQDSMAEPAYNILISFGNPEMGRLLLWLVNKLIASSGKIKITALHLYTGNLFSKFKYDEFEKESFAPIRNEAKKNNIDITAKFKVSEDFNSDIIHEANKDYDLMLIGMGHSIYEGTLLGRLLGMFSKFLNPYWLYKNIGSKNLPDVINLDYRTSEILSRTKIPVGVLINRGLNDIRNVFLIQTEGNRSLEKFIEKVLRKNIHLNIFNLVDDSFSDPNLSLFDLIVISPEAWHQIKNNDKFRTMQNSVLIIKI